MSQSNSRHKRRAVRSIGKKHARDLAKGNGLDVRAEVSQDPVVLGVKIAALERAVQQLVVAQRQNHREIVKAFSLTDAHLWVMRQLCKDIVAESVLMLDGPVKAVNMEAYYDLFNARMRQEAEAAAAAKKAVKAPQEQKNEDAEVFGGNLSNEDSKRDEGSEGRQGAGEVSRGAGGQEAALPEM